MRTVTLYATGECNLRCSHCSVGLDQYEPRVALDTSQLKRALRNLAEGGTKYVTLLGGEVTIYRRDLAELLDEAEMLGLKISINTNGFVPSLLAELADKPALGIVVVSLDGYNSAIHDGLRGSGSFDRAVQAIRGLAASRRARDGDLTIEIAHVLSGANAAESARMIDTARETGAHRLNVKHVEFIGRASEHRDALEFSGHDLVEAYCRLIVRWLLGHEVQLSLQLPAAFAHYLGRRFGFDASSMVAAACAGTEQFGYVDLLGNHMPCPAMSFEENRTLGHARRVPELDITQHAASEIRSQPVFVEFERRRQAFTYRDAIFPCSVCRFNEISSPCTAALTRGETSAEVALCKAVYDWGDVAVPGIRDDIFSSHESNQT